MIGRTACVTGAFLLPWLTAVPLASAADDAQTTGVAAASTRGGSVQCERAGSGVRCLITSQRGIGHATLKRQGKAWPAPLVLRLQLRGLESLTLTAGQRRLEISLTSSAPHRLLVHHAQRNPNGDGEQPRPLAADSPRWPKVLVLDAAGRDVGLRLPPDGGCIEVTIPPKLLHDTGSLDIAWIDFYRG